MRYAGANGRLTLRADSGFYTHGVVSVCRKMDVRFSITIRQHKSLRNLIEAIPEDAWTPIPYWMDGAADVAETTCTPFQSEPDAAPVRLIVRRVKPTPGSQLALFASYSYHGFITDRDGEMLELEADHRRHAEIENAIRDLKHGVGLNHLPSGRFGRQRRLAGGTGDGPQPRPLDSAHRSGRADRGPGRSSSAVPWPDCAPCHSLPDGARPPLTRQPTQRPRKLAPAQSASASCRVLSRHLALHSHCRAAIGAPKRRLQTARQPPVYPNSSPDHRACNSLTPFRCPHAVHSCPSVDSG